MRIAFFGIKRLPATGGADRVVEHLLAHLPRSHDYHVYVIRDADQAPPCSEHVHYIHIPALRGKHLRAFSYFLLCCLHFHLKGHFDVVHAHNSDTGLFCALMRLRPGTRILGTFHGQPYLRKKWGVLARGFLRMSELCFVACCQALTTVTIRPPVLPWPFRSRRVTNIPNGVDPAGPQESADTVDFDALAVEKGQYLLFACGRLDSTKGLNHLLNAYARSSWHHPLLVIGDFSHDRRYSRHIEQISSRLELVHLHRALLAHADLMQVINHCRVFVFPSEVEAMSMMLLEVVSCKKLLVCSDIPENLAIVGPNYPYRFSLSKVGDLEEKLRAAIDDEDPLRTMEPVFERCMREFSWDRIAGEYERLYAATGRLRGATAHGR